MDIQQKNLSLDRPSRHYTDNCRLTQKEFLLMLSYLPNLKILDISDSSNYDYYLEILCDVTKIFIYNILNNFHGGDYFYTFMFVTDSVKQSNGLQVMDMIF
jgi:hypothetical protein